MKKYEAPVVELDLFSVENVMTGASGELEMPDCPTELPDV